MGHDRSHPKSATVGERPERAGASEQPKQKEKSRTLKRSHVLWGLATVAVLTAAVTAYFVWQARQSKAPQYIQISGTIEAPQTHIGAVTACQIKTVNVNEGDRVRKGQTLITFENKALSAARRDAGDGVAAARQVADRASESLGEMKQDEHLLRRKSRGLMGKLLNPFTHNKQKAEKLHLEAERAQTEVAQAEARVAEARSNRDRAAAALSYMNIESPLAAICTTRSVEPGEFVAPGQILLTLVDPTGVYLKGFIEEGDLARIKIGEKCSVYLDSYPSKPLDATIKSIDENASFTPENLYFKNDRVKQVFGVKITIDRPQGLAKPGMPAEARIKLPKAERERGD